MCHKEINYILLYKNAKTFPNGDFHNPYNVIDMFIREDLVTILFRGKCTEQDDHVEI